MIGFGFHRPRMSCRNEIDKYFGQPWRPNPQSMEPIMGRKPAPWEEEKA